MPPTRTTFRQIAGFLLVMLLALAAMAASAPLSKHFGKGDAQSENLLFWLFLGGGTLVLIVTIISFTVWFNKDHALPRPKDDSIQPRR